MLVPDIATPVRSDDFRRSLILFNQIGNSLETLKTTEAQFVAPDIITAMLTLNSAALKVVAARLAPPR